MQYTEYSKSQLEEFADKLNKDFDSERLKKAKPIDVYDVVDFVRADIDWKNISTDRSILGATIFGDCIMPVFEKKNDDWVKKYIKVSAGTIIIDSKVEEDANKGRRNFTVMHEVFHFLYHKKSFTDTSVGLKSLLEKEIFRCYEEKKRGMTPLEILEWQANYMAAAFLIPKSALKNELNIKEEVETRDIDNLKLDKEEIRDLATKFSVSCETMLYRLKGLKIIE